MVDRRPAATGACRPRPPSARLQGVIVLAGVLLAAACGGADDAPRVQGRVLVAESPAGGRPATGPDIDIEVDVGQPGHEPAWVVVAHAEVDRVVARVAPDDSAPAVAELANPTPIGGELVFQVVPASYDDRSDWLEVLLPVRPNGSVGWIRRDEVSLSRNPFRIEIDTSEHHLAVYRENEPFLDTTVAIGTGATPTPIGRFYVIELMRPPTPDGPYGPYAFGLSGFSETLLSFAGGDGVIGIHGTDEPQALGTDVSRGCVRVANGVIESLAAIVPLGTPVVITT